MVAAPPLRVLHVVGGLNRGGVETWLMNVLRHVGGAEVQMDFAVHTDRECAYDREAGSLGARVLPCMHPSRPWKYRRAFSDVLRKHGPYDVVHSHVHHYSGFVLRLARRAGVPVRIAHCHSDTVAKESRAPLHRRAYLGLMEAWVRRYGNVHLACSGRAAVALYGPRWQTLPSCRVIHCGIDVAPFGVEVDRAATRRVLGLPEDAVVIGHVGRFDVPKNHGFLVSAAAPLLREDPRLRLVLVGDGPLRANVEALVRQLGVADRVLFLGTRSDVPRLMRGAMDVFFFPSLYEGLPVTLVEAQAAGLECVISDEITTETDICPSLIVRVPLSAEVEAWRAALARSVSRRGHGRRADAVAEIRNSDFEIGRGAAELLQLYASTLGRARASDGGLQ